MRNQNILHTFLGVAAAGFNHYANIIRYDVNGSGLGCKTRGDNVTPDSVKHLKSVTYCALLLLTPSVIMCTAEMIALSPMHSALSYGFFLVAPIAGLVLAGALLIGLVSLLFLLNSNSRSVAAVVSKTCFLLFVGMLCAIWTSSLTRSDGFDLLAQRTKPLVNAIEKYQKKNGHPPDSLEQLVPEFISKVPGTGIGLYPEYRYQSLDDAKDPWELRVDCSSSILNWDEFYYLPSKNYERREGGWVEQRGDWAYFHE